MVWFITLLYIHQLEQTIIGTNYIFSVFNHFDFSIKSNIGIPRVSHVSCNGPNGVTALFQISFKCPEMSKGEECKGRTSCTSHTGRHLRVVWTEVLFIFPFFNFSMNTRQNKQTESVPGQHLPFIGSWYMNKRLSWLKKATAEAFLDLQTFVTNGVSSLTLSCLRKTSLHSKQHPSVLVENNDRLPFSCTQSIWILSLLPLFYLW